MVLVIPMANLHHLDNMLKTYLEVHMELILKALFEDILKKLILKFVWKDWSL